MIDFKQKLRRSWKQVKAFWPTRIPISDQEFDDWSKDVLETYGWPVNDSFRWSLSFMLMHVPTPTFRKPKRYFGMQLHKAAANQVASAFVQDAKQRQQAEATAKAKELAETNVTQTTTQAL